MTEKSYQYINDNQVLIVAGEDSGDRYASQIVKELKQIDPSCEVFGMGGHCMEKAQAEVICDSRKLSVTGISEAIPKLLTAFIYIIKLLINVKKRKPQIAVLIDAPDFNLRLAKLLKRVGVKVLYFISPQVWAWRKKRIHIMKRVIDYLLVILPFEVSFFKQFDINAEFVGHPLCDDEVFLNNVAHENRESVVLLPGSRKNEITKLLKPILLASQSIYKKGLANHFILPVSKGLDKDYIINKTKQIIYNQSEFNCDNDLFELITDESNIKKNNKNKLILEITKKTAGNVLKSAKLAIAASGTVTLEAALTLTPTIIVYKISKISYLIAKKLVKVKFIGLPNLLLNDKVFPELIQNDATEHHITSEAVNLLNDHNLYNSIIFKLKKIKQMLSKKGVAKRVANYIINERNVSKK